LITRAKMRCEVFTNITSEDIKISESARFGIRALKSFLYFAQYAKFDKPEAIIPNEVRPFEEEVANQLSKAGHTIRQKVGSPGFYLDLAVVDPEHPGRYILGIICDGKAYDSAASATDRDRLRAQVLELFGWNLYQVWSADWYRNPSRELTRLLTAIEQAKQITETTDKENEAWQTEVSREAAPVVEAVNTEYQLAEIHIEHLRPEFHLYTFAELSEWMSQIVKVESPVHFDEVAKRLADAAGVSKVGSRIKYTLMQALDQALDEKKITGKGDFLWSPQMEVPVVRDRSKLPSAYRKLGTIAPEEIHEAIRQVVGAAIAITEQEAIPLVAKLLGFSRVTDEMRQQLSEEIGKSIQLGILTFEGLQLKLG
jgi:hypothetical protein